MVSTASLIRATSVVSLRGIEAVRLRCKCGATLELPMRGDPKPFTQRLQCRVCFKWYSSDPNNHPFNDNPLEQLHASVKCLEKLGGDLEIDLVLPGHTASVKEGTMSN